MSESNKPKLIKAGISYTIGSFFVKGLSFLTLPIFARLLSVEEYGSYSTYIAYEGIMCNVIGMALQISIKNAKYKYGDGYHKYISSILLLEVFSMVIWTIIGLICPFGILNYLGISRIITVLLIVHCFSSTVINFYNIYLSMDFKYHSYLIISVINAVLNIGISIILITTIYSSDKYFGRVLGTVIPLIVVSVGIILYFWKKESPHYNREYWKFGLLFSLPLIPHSLSQVILNQFDRIMINKMVGSKEAGIYSFAYNIFMIITVTMTALDNVWCPWFFERFKAEKHKEIKDKSKYYIVGMLIFVVFIMLISPELVYLAGGDKYSKSVFVVIPICVGGYYCFLYSIPVQVEYCKEKTQYIAIGTISAALINVLLNYIFIRKIGYIAAAYTTEFTYFIYFVLQLIISRRITKAKLFDIKLLFICCFICFIFGVIILLLLNYMYIRWILIVVILLLIILYIRIMKVDVSFVLNKLK